MREESVCFFFVVQLVLALLPAVLISGASLPFIVASSILTLHVFLGLIGPPESLAMFACSGRRTALQRDPRVCSSICTTAQASCSMQRGMHDRRIPSSVAFRRVAPRSAKCHLKAFLELLTVPLNGTVAKVR